MDGGLSPGQAQPGPDLEEIQTEGLGFLALGGQRKVRLLPTSWPADALPAPTSSLLAVASKKGLVAAAGPGCLVLASTSSVRAKFVEDVHEYDDVVDFEPQLNIPMTVRLAQVTYTADETLLVLSAEDGGGLAVYEVDSLMQGKTQPIFELTTNGISIRAVAPNPTAEKANMFALTLTNGDLMMADLKRRQFVSGRNGPVLMQGVSCVAWSKLGKQLVAGLGTGAAVQLTPEGETKVVIPQPPHLEGEQYVSSISWLETHSFIFAHTPTRFDSDTAPSSTFHHVTRQPPSTYVFQKLGDPCPPCGLNRSPPSQFLRRLKDFSPALTDLIVVASTCSTDIGLFTKSSKPLTSDVAEDRINNVFTTTAVADNSRRAQMPMTEDLNETSPIGTAFDLSSKDPVSQPIAGEEIDQSPGPLPALMVLNNDGLLVAWWIVYSESVRQGATYPGMAMATASTQQVQPSQAPIVQPTPDQTALYGSLGPNKSATPANSAAAAFGFASKTSHVSSGGFGASSALGRQGSVWNAAPVSISGQPAFGSTTPVGNNAQAPSLGAPQASPWRNPTTTDSLTGFGQVGVMGARAGGGPNSGSRGSTFGSAGHALNFNAGQGGFGSYANQGGFASAASAANQGGSIFSQSKEVTSNASNDAAMETETSFGPAVLEKAKSGATFGSGGFVLGSTFKGDGTAKDDVPKATDTSSSSFFGSAFGSALGKTPLSDTVPQTKDADMGDGSLGRNEQTQESGPLATPADVTGTAASAPSIFSTSPHRAQLLGGTGKPGFAGTRQSGPQWGDSASTQKSVEATERQTEPETEASRRDSPQVKLESGNVNTNGASDSRSGPEAPLPPEPTSKTSYAAGDSSSSTSTNQTIASDAPLPPDFTHLGRAPGGTGNDPTFPLPTVDDEALEEEGSGEDVAHDLSPSTEPSHTPKATPHSSFGGSFEASAMGGPFTKISAPEAQWASRALFGEVEKGSIPVLPPPAKVQQSPRSPSPVRPMQPSGNPKPDSLRSNSAGILSSRGSGLRKDMRKSQAGSGVHHFKATAARPHGRSFAIKREEVEDLLDEDDEDDEEDKDDEDEEASEKGQAARQAVHGAAENSQTMSDQKDDGIRAELATDAIATTSLQPFIAHQDYVGAISRAGPAGPIEALYRDINSMVDTLGLNARTLQGFAKGHSELFKEGGRDRSDLDQDDGWCLVEVEDLTILEDEIQDQLQDGRVCNIRDKVEEVAVINADLKRLRARCSDIRKIVNSRTDPDQIASTRSADLGEEQAVQQYELRERISQLSRILTEAEEGITLLSAKLSAIPNKDGSAPRQPAPTVEAVMNTIMKMTTMAEKKSGDIDVLENQMRGMRLSSVTSNDSRNGSPVTGSRNAPGFSRTPARRGYGLFYTPDSGRSTPRSMTASVGSPMSSSRFRPSKALAGFTQEDVTTTIARASRRQEISHKLRNSLTKAGPRLMTMED
ncbi:MAG: hypothetical protein M1817_002198 [Caeruleum heppii]|nr:MAG: hypothetical protein M1817_002198 [Caeruleum heppii]